MASLPLGHCRLTTTTTTTTTTINTEENTSNTISSSRSSININTNTNTNTNINVATNIASNTSRRITSNIIHTYQMGLNQSFNNTTLDDSRAQFSNQNVYHTIHHPPNHNNTSNNSRHNTNRRINTNQSPRHKDQPGRGQLPPGSAGLSHLSPPIVAPSSPLTTNQQLQQQLQQAISNSKKPNNQQLAHQQSILDQYPWFHRHLSRQEANLAVLKDGDEGHGVYLVRRSETRAGELVLTFNHHGRVKHLRMDITSDNKCKIQHLTFDSIISMVEHFKHDPIPFVAGPRWNQRQNGTLVTPVLRETQANQEHVCSYREGF